MTVNPRSGYVQVLPLVETQTNSGIIVTTNTEEEKKKATRGIILAVSEQAEDYGLSTGMKVVYTFMTGQDLGDGSLLMHCDDILAVIEG